MTFSKYPFAGSASGRQPFSGSAKQKAEDSKTILCFFIYKTVSFYLCPLSYGIPSALGALEFLDVKARIIIDTMKGIIL